MSSAKDIHFPTEYSADKSKIKDIFRTEPLSNGIELVNDECETGIAPSFAPQIRTIFEDASVRLAQGPPGPSGRDLYETFASAVTWHLRVFQNAHTYVMAFDDKRHVPKRKSAAQTSRRETLDDSMRRRMIPEWHWDNVSPIVEIDDDRPLPPWERIRANSAAYARVIEELQAHLESRYVPPPGRRLIVDTGHRISVVESALDGTPLPPRVILLDKPEIGEGDIAALFYARRAMSDVYEKHDTLSQQQQAFARRADIDSRLLHYYDTSTSSDTCNEVGEHNWLLPHSLRSDSHHVDDHKVRRHYEAGSILWRSVDTDFLSLAIGCLSGLDTPSYERHGIYVALGRVHRLRNSSYCTATTAGAQAHQEYFDMKRIYQELCRLHGAPERCLETAWSFVAFCIACGNDYTRRLHNLSHKTMYAGYKRTFIGDRPRAHKHLVTNFATSAATPAIPLLNPDAFVSLVRHAYYERLPAARRPVHNAVPQWHSLASIVREAFPKNDRSHMPSPDALKAYFNQVSWSLAYASAASYGIGHVP